MRAWREWPELMGKQLKNLALFIFNPKTRQIFGRTVTNWAQIISFYLMFYVVMGAIFATHMAIFLHMTPEPDENVKPWNFGRYAYPNYPNARIALRPLPSHMDYNGASASTSKSNRNAIDRIVSSANESGVSDHCLDGNRGYDTGDPCVFITVQRVMEWIPELMNESLSNAPFLPIQCQMKSSYNSLVVNLTTQPAGIPLDLNNNDGSRSFPFRDQDNYVTPVMAVMVNLTAASGLPSENMFKISIVCSVDYAAIGWDTPSDNRLRRLYEVPEESETSVQFKL